MVFAVLVWLVALTVNVTVNGEVECSKTALPVNGIEPEAPDGDRSTKAIGIPL